MLEEKQLDELEAICADLAGVNSLFDAMNAGRYTHPDALRILGSNLCDVYSRLYSLVGDLEKS